MGSGPSRPLILMRLKHAAIPQMRCSFDSLTLYLTLIYWAYIHSTFDHELVRSLKRPKV